MNPPKWLIRLFLPVLVAVVAALPAHAQLAADGNQVLWDLVPDTDSKFGYSMAVGDFNHDGFRDLAVGIPWADIVYNGNTYLDGGAVQVYYGSTGGLGSGSPVHFDIGVILGEAVYTWPDDIDLFGYALAAADFNGDDFDDLAIGAPRQGDLVHEDSGRVWFLYGGAAGLDLATGYLFSFGSQGNPRSDNPEDFDYFGWSLAAGDVNGDGFDDVLIGVPGEDVGSHDNAGAVQIFFGDPVYGQRIFDDQFWHQNVPDTAGGAEDNDEFGKAVAAGDFNGDDIADLAVGIPFEDLGTVVADAGAVHVFYGVDSIGLTVSDDEVWTQNSSGILDYAEELDQFGFALTAADLDGDGHDELVVGAPYESLPGAEFAGAVNLIFGSTLGLGSTGNQLWHQNVPGTYGGSEVNDLFGSALAACDYEGSGRGDLVVGIPGESLGAVLSTAGAIHAFYAALGALGGAGDFVWHQDRDGMIGHADPNDAFGDALACGDFNGDGAADLAVGIPGETLGSWVRCGSVQILYGVPGVFFDGFESGGFDRWSSAVP